MPIKRDDRLDILRVIGLVCIVLAHAGPPGIIKELRTFDVPLMVMVSGVAFGLSSRRAVGYGDYLRKRIPRLLAPTWAFLIIFFSVAYLLSMITHDPYPFTPKIVIESFSLLSGIGYLWIVRVFLLIALSAPLILRVNSKIESNLVYLILIAGVFGAHELLVANYSPVAGLDMLVSEFLFYLVPYSCLFAIGLRLPTIEENNRALFLFVTAACILTFLLYHFYDPNFSLDDYKYPPRLFYTCYGVVATVLLYCLFEGTRLDNMTRGWIVFISTSTIWIYLWHIFILKLAIWYPSIFHWFSIGFMARCALLFVLPAIITYLQKTGIQHLMRRLPVGSRSEAILSTVFLK